MCGYRAITLFGVTGWLHAVLDAAGTLLPATVQHPTPPSKAHTEHGKISRGLSRHCRAGGISESPGTSPHRLTHQQSFANLSKAEETDRPFALTVSSKLDDIPDDKGTQS